MLKLSILGLSLISSVWMFFFLVHLLIHIEFLSLDKVSQLHVHGAYVEINQGSFVRFAHLTLRVLKADSIATLKNEEAKPKQNSFCMLPYKISFLKIRFWGEHNNVVSSTVSLHLCMLYQCRFSLGSPVSSHLPKGGFVTPPTIHASHIMFPG